MQVWRCMPFFPRTVRSTRAEKATATPPLATTYYRSTMQGSLEKTRKIMKIQVTYACWNWWIFWNKICDVSRPKAKTSLLAWSVNAVAQLKHAQQKQHCHAVRFAKAHLHTHDDLINRVCHPDGKDVPEVPFSGAGFRHVRFTTPS